MVWAKFTKFSVIKAINKIDSYGIPWAPINGNHDGEGNVDLAWIANKYEKAENCLFKQGPDNIGGIGNYIINIRENDKIRTMRTDIMTLSMTAKLNGINGR